MSDVEGHTDVFKIAMPMNEGIAEVRTQEDGRFEVYVTPIAENEEPYISAGGFETFADAVRNIMDPLWVACLPFDKQ